MALKGTGTGMVGRTANSAARKLHAGTKAARHIGRTRIRTDAARGRWRPPANPGGS